MFDELRLDTKLFGFDGVIGRRDYFLNIVYIYAIATLLNLPFTFSMLSSAETFLDLFNPAGMFVQSSVFLKFWTLLAFGFIAYLDMGLSIRRLNDINGRVNKPLNIALAVFTVFTCFSLLLPLGLMSIISTLAFIVTLILLFKTGKVTGKLPYDFRKEFNWGAFFGTWIWGIVNKSYHTFWYWILCWTPIGFYYQLVCGLKGNEWAYKNRKWSSDEEFKSSQEKQTIVFVVLSMIVLPVLIFILTMVIVFAIAFTAVNETNNSPNQESPTISKLDKALNSYFSLYFESHTLTADENKFYVLPKDWNGYSFSEKKDVLEMAATTSATERSKNGKHSSKTKELPRTKIYNSINGELLGEFVMDESLFETEKPDFKQIVKASMKAYRFYRATEK